MADKIIALLLLCIFFCSTAFCQDENKGRKYNLGVLDYSLVYNQRYRGASLRIKDEIITCFKGLRIPHVVIKPFLFNQNKSTECNLYKRIFIPAMSPCFTEEMYKGMVNYVKKGGLLISNSMLTHLDLNYNFKLDNNDKVNDFAANNLLGIKGRMSGKIDKLTILKKCPITEGLPLQQELTLSVIQSGRGVTTNLHATVLINSSLAGTYKFRQTPYLTFFHQGKGAAIFVNGRFTLKSMDDQTIQKLLVNIMNEKTLSWLCLQEEE